MHLQYPKKRKGTHRDVCLSTFVMSKSHQGCDKLINFFTKTLITFINHQLQKPLTTLHGGLHHIIDERLKALC
jgi:hypothetical protein